MGSISPAVSIGRVERVMTQLWEFLPLNNVVTGVAGLMATLGTRNTIAAHPIMEIISLWILSIMFFFFFLHFFCFNWKLSFIGYPDARNPVLEEEKTKILIIFYCSFTNLDFYHIYLLVNVSASLIFTFSKNIYANLIFEKAIKWSLSYANVAPKAESEA